MKDKILAERIEALRSDLQWAQDKSKSWLESKFITKPDELTQELWGVVGRAIEQATKDQIDYIQDIYISVEAAEKENGYKEKEALKQAWRRYAEIYKESRQIFGEYLDFISGLLIRYQKLDVNICRLADELIRNCSLASTGATWQSLSVLALQEPFTKTLARIIRLRFPEWSIWSLPLAAHEYGHVVAGELDGVKQFVQGEVKRMLKDNPEYIDAEERLRKDADDKQAQEDKNRLEGPRIKQVNVLFADAFAIYTMGPAYACASVMLRFDPSNAYTEYPERPPDAWRAFVVLATLKMMSWQAAFPQSVQRVEDLQLDQPSKDGPHMFMINWLTDCFEEMLERAGSPNKLPDDDIERLSEQSRLIWRVLKRALLNAAQYPLECDKEGWSIAFQQAQKWGEALEKGYSLLEGLADSQIIKVRDLLNAAWVCRIGRPGKIREIEEAAQKLCDRIIPQQRPPNTPSGSGRTGSATPHGM
jgi:hypothetical protein